MKKTFYQRAIFCTLWIVITQVSTSFAITDEQANTIIGELREIRSLLEKQQKPGLAQASQGFPTDKVSIPVSASPVLGVEDAPLTLVEFADYQCPFCNRFHLSTFQDLKKNYIDKGLLRFVSRDLPLDIHKNARYAARATRCAGEQNKYWDLHHLFNSNPNNLESEGILHYATEVGIDIPQFKLCLDNERHLGGIEADIAAANSIGITGTPGFVLGYVKNGNIEGIKIVGAQSYAVFDSSIKRMLAGKETNTKNSQN